MVPSGAGCPPRHCSKGVYCPRAPHRVAGTVTATHDRLLAVVGLHEQRSVGAVGHAGGDPTASVVYDFCADGAGRKETANDTPVLVDPGLSRMELVVLAKVRTPASLVTTIEPSSSRTTPAEPPLWLSGVG